MSRIFVLFQLAPPVHLTVLDVATEDVYQRCGCVMEMTTVVTIATKIKP
jgi:hypothetical protein